VGVSFAGFAILEALQDRFDITIIDKNDYFEYVPSNPRSAVE
jgi:NADH dehydrogenase FAD-containing subunit